MKQVIFYSKRVAAFALACFVVVFSIGFSSSAATVATDLHADINMNVEIKYTDGTFSQSDPELIGKTPFNVDPEDWAMAAPPVFSNKQISHVRVNTDLTGYQVPSTVIPPDPVSVIKAGTYRFNDVLTQGHFYNDINGLNEVYFDYQTVAVINGESVTLYCSAIYQEPFEVGSGSLQYTCSSSDPDLTALGITYPFGRYVYTGSYGTPDSDSWDYTYGTGIQTITIPTDTEVSAEFLEWFTANTVATPLDQVIPDDPEPETPVPVVGKTVQMRVFYRVELGLVKDAVSSISVNSGTRSGTVWTPLPYTTISSKYAMDTSTGSSYIDATIQFTLPADSEVLRVYGTFYTSPFTASNIGEVVGGVQVCEFLYLDPVTDQDPSDKVEVDRVDGVVSDKLDQTGQITDTIEQLQKPTVDVNGSGAPVIGGMVVDPMQQVDPENFGSYTSVIGAIFGSGTILGYFVIAFSMIFISYVIFGKSG